MRHDFRRELASAGLATTPGPATPVSEAEVLGLPAAARRYMTFMRVVGRPRAWSFRAAFTGRFRPGLGQDWRDCEAWQYDRRAPIARYFRISMRYFGPVPVVARDTYAAGEGHMKARLLDLFTVADASGEPFDIGELVTWLNDAVLLAPSMLLAPEVAFAAVDDGAFDLTLTDRGHTVKARVLVDERGAPTDFITADRFYADPAHPNREPIRTRWSTPVLGWNPIGTQPTFTRAHAVWHLPESPYVYADFAPVPGELVFNEPPGA